MHIITHRESCLNSIRYIELTWPKDGTDCHQKTTKCLCVVRAPSRCGRDPAAAPLRRHPSFVAYIRTTPTSTQHLELVRPRSWHHSGCTVVLACAYDATLTLKLAKVRLKTGADAGDLLSRQEEDSPSRICVDQKHPKAKQQILKTHARS